MSKCPGQNLRFWGVEDIFDVPCPQCGRPVEFFKDDSRRRCQGCGKLIFNPRNNFSCANWCPAARECLGPERYDSLRELAQKESQRKSDMEALLDSIPLKEWEVRLLFKRMYLEQGSPERLFEAELLREVKEKNPPLFEKATRYYQEFRKRRKR
jgi:hypothetical protein